MGYTTQFEGKFIFNKPLEFKHADYLNAFARIRHMKRHNAVAIEMHDPIRENVELPIGNQAMYFVGSAFDGNKGQTNDKSVVDYNYPPAGVPSLWLHWVVSRDGRALEWDEGEKFYDYVEWLQFLITHFFSPWGYVLNGKVQWQGEDLGDIGTIEVENNIIKVTDKFI